MPWTELLTAVRAEITAAEHQTTAQAGAVMDLLAAGRDSTGTEQALFCELDGLALLRERLRTIEVLRDHLAAA